jgi:circadian clock protein KaiC
MADDDNRTGAHFAPRLGTGVPGLDDVLEGGLPARHLYLVEGTPGSGKTTVALQFLLEGVNAGETGLYVALSESRHEITQIAASHGWSIEGVSILEVSSRITGDELETTLYEPAEVELGERMHALLAEIDRLKPSRVVVDSCAELRLLAQSPLRYRRQILALKDRLATLGSTILLLDDRQPETSEMPLETVVHGVILLEQLAPLYGAERRRLRVLKLRGHRFRGGYHDFVIRTGGLQVFPRLIAAEHHVAFSRDVVASGLPELDALLGGGAVRGSSVLLMGPSGTGKSAVASQYAVAAAERGEDVAVYAFDENLSMLLARAESLGLPLKPHVDSGRVYLQQVDPAELPPGQFVHAVRDAVERRGIRIIVIDSLTGFMNAMPEENFLALQLHELLSYLAQRGVLTILTVAQHGLLGAEAEAPIDVSYLADSVLLFRYFEAGGQVRKALSVLKMRSGRHESTIRELQLGSSGVRVGPVLHEFAGVLSGHPHYVGAPAPSGAPLGRG